MSTRAAPDVQPRVSDEKAPPRCLQTLRYMNRVPAQGPDAGPSRTVTNMPRNEASAESQNDRSVTNVASCPPAVTPERSPSVNQRAHALADRLEQGARALATLASALTDAQYGR